VPADATHKTFSVAEVAERYAVNVTTVRQWIAAGELPAVNTSRSRYSKKPRYRVTQAALDAFEAARTPATPVERVRRRKAGGYVPRFYK
jgi:excisionase family DNA binding protein